MSAADNVFFCPSVLQISYESMRALTKKNWSKLPEVQRRQKDANRLLEFKQRHAKALEMDLQRRAKSA
jgi:hypothetical protein